MKITSENSLFLLIDIQEKLLPAMSNKEQILNNNIRLCKAMNVFNIPVVVSQQYTKGLGETVSELKDILGECTTIEKTSFSCCKNQDFNNVLKTLSKPIVILSGIETHICVEQTALDLIEHGFIVYIVCDCVGSRNNINTEISLNKLLHKGAIVTSYESLIYEILEDSKSPFFKEISSIIK